MMCKPIEIVDTEADGGKENSEIVSKGIDREFWVRMKEFLKGEFTTPGQYEKVCEGCWDNNNLLGLRFLFRDVF
jgi:hypothetical protein